MRGSEKSCPYLVTQGFLSGWSRDACGWAVQWLRETESLRQMSRSTSYQPSATENLSGSHSCNELITRPLLSWALRVSLFGREFPKTYPGIRFSHGGRWYLLKIRVLAKLENISWKSWTGIVTCCRGQPHLYLRDILFWGKKSRCQSSF